jgi:hypothetical protein
MTTNILERNLRSQYAKLQEFLKRYWVHKVLKEILLKLKRNKNKNKKYIAKTKKRLRKAHLSIKMNIYACRLEATI